MVTTELELARYLGIKLLPILVEISGERLPNSLKFADEYLPEEIREEVNLNYLKVASSPTSEELGKIPKAIYNLLSSIYREPMWRTPPQEFLYLLPPRKDARAVLYFGSLDKAIKTYGFGKTAAICPTSLAGSLSGPISKEVIEAFTPDHLNPQSISPERPAMVGYHCKELELHLIAATVFNEDFTPRSRDQRAAAKSILELCCMQNIDVVLTPLLGTGDVYDYPRFQAYKSFLAGFLSFLRLNSVAGLCHSRQKSRTHTRI